MKTRIFFRILYVFAFLVITANTAFSAVKSLSPDIADLPEGELLFSSVSPAGTSQVNFYVVKNSIGSAIRGEKVDGNSRFNIYWQTGTDTADTVWVDEYRIVINGMTINVLTDKFDCRRGTAIFSQGSTAEQIINNE